MKAGPIVTLGVALCLAVLGSGMAAHARDGASTIEPNVVSEFNTGAAGGGARPLMGDITGDGRLDIVMMQPHYKENDAYEGALVAALTAYDIEGNLLWQAGKVDPRGRNQGTDIPAQIYDVDGDGENEVIAIMHEGFDTAGEGRFMIFDGDTGKLERDFELPHPEAHDAIIFANLTGKETPRDIILKDRYSRIWALDSRGNVLWSHKGNTGHYPWPYDFDGDGYQEIMAGYDLLTHKGKLMWTADMADHADTIWMADVNEDGEMDIVLGGAETVAHNWRDGEEIWRNEDTVESQNIMVGDFLPGLQGLESLGLDRIDRSANGYDGLFLLDRYGELVWKESRETRGCWGSIPEPIHNWTGGYSDLIMVWNRGCGEPTTIMDGSGNTVTELDDARLWHADFCGDDKEEVIEYVQGEWVRIVANGPCDLEAKVSGEPLPQAKRLYNYTRYTAGDTPVNLAGGAPATASSEQGAHTADRATDGEASRAWRAHRSGAGEWIEVDLGRQHTLTGTRLVLERAQTRRSRDGSGRYEYRIEVSVDGESWRRTARAAGDAGSREEEQLFTAQGRYVRVTFTDLPDNARAGLAELEVLGNR